jgi:HAE1 family hydrophobic/amphiphilic exporter-1
MNLPEFAARRAVTTLMIFFAAIVVGGFCLFQMPIDLFPEMDVPVITVITPYEGAGPEDIEEKVTDPLEERLSTVEELEHIYSTSREDMSIIRLSFSWQTDLDNRANDVRDAIDLAQREIPDEADESRIFKFDVSQFPILVYGVRATQSYEDLEDLLEDRVANVLESIPGVASVRAITPLNRQVNVDLDREKLASHGLSPDQVVGAISRENREVSAGSIEMGYTDYLPRVPGEFESVEPMKDIVLTVRNGNIVHLRDVGQISDAFEEIRRYITVNGQPGAILLVSKNSDANTVTVAKAVRRRMPQLAANLPDDVQISNVMDAAEDIERMVADLVRTLLIGGGLAMVAVFIFLRQVRGTFIIGLAIPFSLILAAGAMYLFGYTINMMTLFALIIAIGMVVDNAIVILENITRHREEGESPMEGAVYGASEVAMAITASTLTTLCIFFPLVFVRGIAQIIFVPFAVVAAVVLLASLFCAVTLTPMLASRLLPAQFVPLERQNALFRVSERAFARFASAYGWLLGLALRHRGAAVAAAVVVFVATGSLVPRIGFEFMPKEDRGLIQGTVELPVGTRVEVTRDVMRDIDRIIREEIPAEGVKAVFTRCGKSESGFSSDEGAYVGHFGVSVVAKDKRDWSIFDMADRLRTRIKGISGIHSIEEHRITLEDPMAGLIMGGEKPLSVNILGDDMEATDRLARRIEEKVRDIPGAVDIGSSREKGAPELWVKVHRDKASAMGLNVSDVAETVRTSIYGRVASKYRVRGDEYDIFVRMREQDRATVEDMQQIPLKLPTGDIVRLENVADVTFQRGPSEIERKDQHRIVRVEGDAEGRSLGVVIEDVRDVIKKMDVPPDIQVDMGGQSEDIEESYLWLTIALGLGVVLVYMVMASQFESLVHPFVVMFSVPFAFVGVAWALYLGGYNLSIVVFLGMLMLVGIVVNNAIVLVDYANILRARGRSMSDALLEAGKTRLRPVLMTAFTTILALVPMAFQSGQGSEVWNPLGVTILGGLLVATFVTLIIVPVAYSVIETRLQISE